MLLHSGKRGSYHKPIHFYDMVMWANNTLAIFSQFNLAKQMLHRHSSNGHSFLACGSQGKNCNNSFYNATSTSFYMPLDGLWTAVRIFAELQKMDKYDQRHKLP